MPRIELQQLLRPTTTPEQEILLTHFYNQFDNRSAANKSIVNVEPLYYQGVIAGTEFLTYAATKLYICYKSEFHLGGSTSTLPRITFYNEGNVLSSYGVTAPTTFNTDVLLALFNSTDVKKENIYFSRFVTSIYTYMNFNGYRITLA